MDYHVIRYEFVSGEVVQIKVTGEIAEFLYESRRREHASNERYWYHSVFSLDSEDSRCGQLISYKIPDDQIIEAEEHQRLHGSIAHLSAVQQERLLVLADGRSIAEIARSQHAAYNSVKGSIRAAQQKKSEKFSENTLNFTPFFLLISENPLRPHLENSIVQSSGTSQKVLL